MPLSSFIKDKIKDKDYSSLQEDLRRIRVPESAREYASQAILYSILIAVALIPTFTFALTLIFDLSILISLGAASGIGVGGGISVYLVFMTYPNFKASSRKEEIEDMFPHATAYMLALSKGGFEPIEIFDNLSDEDEYGEVSKEAGAIARNSKVLGYSPIEAIEDVAETTPSEKLSDFLNSFSSVIKTGASITEFLERRSERYYEEARESQEEDLELLGVLSEIYVATLGMGPVLGIIIIILFGMMGQFMENVLYLIVYLFIPLGTGAFMILLDMQFRTGFGEVKKSKLNGGSSDSFLESVSQKLNHSKNHFSSFRKLINSPMIVLWITVPVALSFSAFAFYVIGADIETAVTSLAIISLTPLAVLFELKRMRKEKMIRIAPDFLASFSDSLSSGLPPSRAFFSLSPERFGVLGSEIKRIRRDIEWGRSASDAFKKSANRMMTGVVSHVMSLLQRSSKMASDIGGILEVLSEDMSMEKSLQEERRRVTVTYVIIVFMSFGIFILTAYSLSTSFVPLMTRVSEEGAKAGGQTSEILVSGISPEAIKEVFFRASLMQGFFSGLLAGMMQTGKISSGLKYSMIMLAIAWVFFTYLGF